MNILEFMSDPQLAGRLFSSTSWATWRVLVAAMFGLPIAPKDLDVYRRLTGRETVPTSPVREAWIIAGRRGGKTRAAALVAVWIAALFSAMRRADKVLAPGERGVILLLAQDRQAAAIALKYAEGIIDSIPMLAREVVERQKERIVFDRVEIRVGTSSYRSVRGYTLLCVVCDELAFWPSDETSVNPDEETIAAVRPGLATVPESLLLCVSSPYARRGALWNAFDRGFGKETPDVLVARASSRDLNPTLPQSVVDAALAEDEPRARSEYLAEFRSDIEAFVSLETIRDCVVPHRSELPPMRSISYKAFTDPSGGSADSWTLCIAHREKSGMIVVDALRERRAPFVPNEVAAEFSALLKAYGVTEVCGDRFGGEWPREALKQHGVRYVPSERTKSELYGNLLPILNGRGVELPNDAHLIAQLCGLERYVSRGGRDTIDHRRAAHDDLANAVAGVAYILGRPRSSIEADFGNYTALSDGSGEIVFLNSAGVELARCEAKDAKQVRSWLDVALRRRVAGH